MDQSLENLRDRCMDYYRSNDEMDKNKSKPIIFQRILLIRH
jgi:uncharacterized membrane protein (DUF106 family)